MLELKADLELVSVVGDCRFRSLCSLQQPRKEGGVCCEQF